MRYPLLPYAITEIYCVVFAATIWVRLDRSLGSEDEVRQLRNMVISFMAMLITDTMWAFMENGLLHLPHLLNALINAICIIAICSGCYFWFRYIEDRLSMPLAGNRNMNRLLAVPVLFIVFLDLASIFTGWMFIIDAQGHYQDMPLFVIQTAVNYFYLVVPTVYSLYRAAHTSSHADRNEYYTYSLYMIAPLISGMLEDYLPEVPLLALNIFLMILILYLMIQHRQIYNDALTGLNNRRRLNQHLEDCLEKATPGNPLLLFIADINDFKLVNDQYGHLEGDNALKFYAAVMKTIAGQYNAFVARYGGDEFCLVMSAGPYTGDEISEAIRNALKEAQEKSDHAAGKYELTASIGWVSCDGTEHSPNIELAKADQALYENKKEWHKEAHNVLPIGNRR